MQRYTYVSAAAAVVLALGGPVAAAATASADTAKAPSATTVARAEITAEAAASAALKAHPGVIESLNRDGAVWHVDVISKDGTHAEIDVDAASGGVTKESQDDEQRAKEYADLLAAKVTATQAIKTALAAHPGKVWSVDWYDADNGRAAYWNVEVKTTNGKTQKVHVDTATAKVVPSDNNGNDGEDGQDGNSGS
ncbi:PepSY domain-containing protein [Streptomyces sp. ISL-66]|uniref:PepSY domain-containing protein n=1 Tax=Streptomyces sp. ISL-66 TaxID=2819186 RepID=UPI001BE9C009|nr:PepSY domain-containing protein [Streptomyces sp. ISL-66]MBT2472049.1 PepSY domain-containing protein [Streptomyces sp. ISL-66]